MKRTKKYAMLTAAGVIAASTVVGGATYALFKSSATSTGNTFTAGTLRVEAQRDDVPFNGPMFYTNSTSSQPGTLPTGVWAPGDRNTRALFLSNKSDLPAKLQTLTLIPTDSSGTRVSNGTNYDGDMLFANHSRLTIWDIKLVDYSQAVVPWGPMQAQQINQIMTTVNDGYQRYLNSNPANWDPTQDPNFLNRMVEAVNAYLLDHINDIRNTNPGGNFNDRFVRIDQVVREENMQNLIETYTVPTNNQIQLTPQGTQNDTALLAYTVELKTSAPNTLQNASAYFTFGSTWQQNGHH